VEDPSDDELDTYSDNVKKRIKELTHARHDERRAKEALSREKQELERIAQHMIGREQTPQTARKHG
jgi:septation ring formation regulator EzrA